MQLVLEHLLLKHTARTGTANGAAAANSIASHAGAGTAAGAGSVVGTGTAAGDSADAGAVNWCWCCMPC